MARLTAAQRRALPASSFAGPGRSYPVEDRTHAIAAKSMAAQHASPALEKKIDARANKVLRKPAAARASKAQAKPKARPRAPARRM